MNTRENWDRKKIIVSNAFAYAVPLDIVIDNDDPEPKSVEECRHRDDWTKWKETIQTEINSLENRKVFGPVVRTPEGARWI